MAFAADDADVIVPLLVRVPPLTLKVTAPVEVTALLLVKLPPARFAVNVPLSESVPLLTMEPPAVVLSVMLLLVATVTLALMLRAVAEALLVVIVTGPPFRFKVLTLVGLGGLPVCSKVMEPVPVGAMLIDPPLPVFTVEVAPETVSRLTVRLALLAVPELIEIALAPELASIVPPLV